MKKHDKPSKIIVGLSAYITELDSLRPPSRFGFSSQSFTVTMELLFKQRQKSYFFKKNRELYHKIKKERYEYLNDNKVDSKEMLVPIIYVFITLFFILAINIGITYIYSLSLFQSSLIMVITGLPLLYVSFSFAIRRLRRVVGERHDKDVKRSVQYLIDFGVQFTENNNLNQDMFPIKLRHNDYEGLIYERKGKNSYVGFLKERNQIKSIS